MLIHRLPAFTDNYLFVLEDPRSHEAIAVDPGDAQPILHCLERLGATLVGIWQTHHHADHIGGTPQLLARFPLALVYGGAEDRGRLPGQRVFLVDGDRLGFAGRKAEVIFVPGHTRAHIAYYFPPQQDGETGELFCGDTLFAGGCGRLFEGTPQQMQTSLARLRQLPDQTRVWCAHEYTLGNLRFALSLEPHNQEVQERFQAVEQARQHQQPTIPSLLGLEKRTNPFLRWDSLALQQLTEEQEPAKVLGKLRGMKDHF